MRKPKFILRVDRNKRGHVYVNGKWLKDVTKIDIHGEPFNYTITVEQNVRDAKGRISVIGNEIETKTTKYYVWEKTRRWT